MPNENLDDGFRASSSKNTNGVFSGDLFFRKGIIDEARQKGVEWNTIEFLVYQRLRWYETDGKFGFMVASNEHLAEEYGLNVRQVKDALCRLASAGLVVHVWCDKKVYRNKTKIWMSAVRLAGVGTRVDAIKVLDKNRKNTQVLDLLPSEFGTVCENLETKCKDLETACENIETVFENVETVFGDVSSYRDGTGNGKEIEKSNERKNKRKIKKVIKESYDDVFDKLDVEDELKEVFIGFIESRKANKKVMTSRALELAISKARKLSDDLDEQVAIVNQSIEHCWQGLYPLKEPIDKVKQAAGADDENVVLSDEARKMFDKYEQVFGFPLARNEKNIRGIEGVIGEIGSDLTSKLIEMWFASRSDKYSPRVQDFAELHEKYMALIEWGQRKGMMKKASSEDGYWTNKKRDMVDF